MLVCAPEEGELIIKEVVPQGSAARHNRLKEGDTILRIDGVKAKLLCRHIQDGGVTASPLLGPAGSVIHLIVQRVSDRVFFLRC